MFLHHFVHPDLRVKIFEKEGSINCETKDQGTSVHLHWRDEENFMSDFIVLWWQKKLLKPLLTCTFSPWLLDSFDMPSYSSESRKRYTLMLLLMRLDMQRGEKILEVVLPECKWFTWETWRSEETMLLSKTVPEDLNQNLTMVVCIVLF